MPFKGLKEVLDDLAMLAVLLLLISVLFNFLSRSSRITAKPYPPL
jgi:hypothetical protein